MVKNEEDSLVQGVRQTSRKRAQTLWMKDYKMKGCCFNKNCCQVAEIYYTDWLVVQNINKNVGTMKGYE